MPALPRDTTAIAAKPTLPLKERVQLLKQSIHNLYAAGVEPAQETINQVLTSIDALIHEVFRLFAGPTQWRQEEELLTCLQMLCVQAPRLESSLHLTSSISKTRHIENGITKKITELAEYGLNQMLLTTTYGRRDKEEDHLLKNKFAVCLSVMDIKKQQDYLINLKDGISQAYKKIKMNVFKPSLASKKVLEKLAEPLAINSDDQEIKLAAVDTITTLVDYCKNPNNKFRTLNHTIQKTLRNTEKTQISPNPSAIASHPKIPTVPKKTEPSCFSFNPFRKFLSLFNLYGYAKKATSNESAISRLSNDGAS